MGDAGAWAHAKLCRKDRSMEMGDLISLRALLERYGEPCHSFLDVIEAMPAIDAEPVRHSKWMCRTPGVFSCGACLGLALGNRPTCYCHDCGAKMDGEEE